MTCIVGIKDKDRIIFGADSMYFASVGLSWCAASPKVFKVGDFMFGVCGCTRTLQVLQYAFNPTDKPKNMPDYQYICSVFVDDMRSCLKKCGVLEVKDGVETNPEGMAMVGYNGEIYVVWGNFGVSIYTDPYGSIGCGQNFALGVMHYLYKKEKDKKKILKEALSVASYFDPGVEPPFTYLELPFNK